MPILPLDCSTDTIIASTVDGNYTYVGYASDDSGSDFSTNFVDGTHEYIAVVTSETEIVSFSASNCTGKWAPLGIPAATVVTNFTYVAYADEQDGTGYTETYDDTKRFIAILYSEVEIPDASRDATDFAGIWMKIERDGNTFTYNNPLIYDTQRYGDYTYLSLSSTTWAPKCFYYHGTYRRFYFTTYSNHKYASGAASSHGYNKNYISYYDLDSRSISNLIEVPISAAASTSTDRHNVSILIVADDGHIIVVQEDLDQSPGGGGTAHNSSFEIYRSVLAEEIEDPSTPAGFHFTKVTEVGLSVDDTYWISYPSICLGPNSGELFLMARAQYITTGYHDYTIIYKSIDNGVIWKDLSGSTNLGTIVSNCDITGPDDWYSYSRMIPCERANGICLVINTNEGPDGNTYLGGETAANRYKGIYFLQSYDGITWNNVERFIEGTGGYSKNIVTSGHITATQLTTNFKVDDVLDSDEQSLFVVGAAVGTDKIPVLVAVNWDRWESSDSPDYIGKMNMGNSLSTYYYNTTTNLWVNTDISDLYSDKTSTIGVEPLLFDFASSFVNYGEGMWDIGMKRLTYAETLEEPTYSAISSDSNRYDGLMYEIVTTAANNFGEGLIIGDIVAVGASTASCDGSNTLKYVPSEFAIYRTRDWGISYQLVNEPYRMPSSTYTGCTNSFNYLDSKNLMVMFAVNRMAVAGTVTHSDYVYYSSEID